MNKQFQAGKKRAFLHLRHLQILTRKKYVNHQLLHLLEVYLHILKILHLRQQLLNSQLQKGGQETL
jgi:hypothetical protein